MPLPSNSCIKRTRPPSVSISASTSVCPPTRYTFASVLLLTDDDDVKEEARAWAHAQVGTTIALLQH